MSDDRKYLKVNRNTGDLELIDFPYPDQARAILDDIYREFAFEPLDLETIEKMNQYVEQKLEKLS